MQTPKTKVSSIEVPQNKSPATPQTARQLKTPGSDANSVSTSPHPSSRTPKNRSPKVIQRRSPQSPASEKKRPGRVSELEAQLAQHQEDLKKAKDQLNSSESGKRRVQQEAEDAKKQLLVISSKLEESQKQLLELTDSDDARIQELRKISQDRDRAWQSELEAVQKQHFIDSSALASAMNELQKLKAQLDVVIESEVTQTKHAEAAHSEIQGLKLGLSETLSVVEKLKFELRNCKESEAQAQAVISDTKMQLETANETIEKLQLDGTKAAEAYNTLLLQLDQSRAQVKSLEKVVTKFQENVENISSKNLSASTGDIKDSEEDEENEKVKQLKSELDFSKFELDQLRLALDAAETRYQEEYIQSTMQIRSTYEQVEHTKSEWIQKEAELEAELKKAKADVENLRANLMDKETQLQIILEENEGLDLQMKQKQDDGGESKLAMELKKSESNLAEWKANFMEKETELQTVKKENEMLQNEIWKRKESSKANNEAIDAAEAARVAESNKANNEAIDAAEAARVAEREALMKLEYLTEEADKNSRRAARVTEQLDAAQATNTEMEAELRRLKVQSDQWRKAAEAAASMLSTGNNGKYAERTGSLDSSYNHIARRMGSPNSDDLEDDSPKKKNGNMLKKIGGLWKKGH